MLCLRVFQLFDRVGDCAALGLAGADNEEHAVALGGQDNGIRDHVDRGGIENDVIVVLAQICQKCAHARRAEQLGGVGRDIAGEDHVQTFDPAGDHDLVQQRRVEQEIAQAHAGAFAQQTRKLRAAQIAVHQ